MKVNEVIRKPVVTEKATLLQEKQIYTFWVNAKATKIDVKNAIKAIYGAEPLEVRIINIAEKMKALKKGSYNKRPERRKAYVTLGAKFKLDLNKFEKTDKETKITLAPSKSKAAPAKKTTKAKQD